MFKKTLPYLIIAIIFSVFWFVSPFQSPMTDNKAETYLKGQVKQIIEEGENFQKLEVQIEDGARIIIDNDESMSASPRIFEKDDKVLLSRIQLEDGSPGYYIADYLRSNALLWLLIIFMLAVILVTKWQGIRSLIGMLFSFVVLFKMVLPLILQGYDPVLIAILGAILIIPIIFYFSHGFSRKTTIAAIATIATLIVTGLLAKFFADFGNLTGLASEEANFLKLETQKNIDFSGLVLAGMIITVLGILDDITISQSSIVQQLKSANKKLPFSELFKRAMHVGHDHISSLVNTLILVYTGASLPLLLLFMDHAETFSTVINFESVAQEIIQTMVGSIGLILAVPITTFIAAFTIGKTDLKDDGREHGHSHEN